MLMTRKVFNMSISFSSDDYTLESDVRLDGVTMYVIQQRAYLSFINFMNYPFSARTLRPT